MLTDRPRRKIAQPGLIVVLLAAASVSLVPTLALTANDASVSESFAVSSDASSRADLKDAAGRFLQGMAAADEEVVWMFASEEEHDAFGTEQAAYDAYAEAFPALTQAHGLTFERFWQEGDTPFVELTLTTGATQTHVATMGLWLDDAGDWKVVSLDVKPVSDLVAGL